MKQVLRYFWKYMLTTFLIELVWFIMTFSLGFFFIPDIMRNLAMVGFIVFPFIIAYNTFWIKIDELESFIEQEYYKKKKIEDSKIKTKKNNEDNK